MYNHVEWKAVQKEITVSPRIYIGHVSELDTAFFVSVAGRKYY